MRTTTGRAPRVLHVLAVYDQREAQARCIHTIASFAAGEHFLVCSTSSGYGEEVFGGVVQTGAPMWGFGWMDHRRIETAVRSIRPDVIHFHGGPLGATTMSTGWTAGVPAVASIYGWPTVNRRSWGGGVGLAHLRRTPVLAPRSFGNTVAPRVLLAASLRRSGVRVAITPDRSVTEALAHQALPVGTYEGVTPPRPQHPRRPRRGRFVFAGRAELTRGPDLLADAVSRLRSAGRDVTADFFFLGTHDVDMVAATAAAPGCSVTVGAADLPAEMSTATAVVLPFRFDATTSPPALVATEAMAAGVPVVGGDVSCLRSAITDEQTGLLVRPGDVGALCRALIRLDDDPALVAALGARATAEIARRWRRSSLVDLAEWAYMVASTDSDSPVQPRPTVGPVLPSTSVREVS